MWVKYFLCFIAILYISNVRGDATIDDNDIIQQLVNRMEKLEDEIAKKDEIIEKLKNDVAVMEDDIEDRVSKLEELAKIGTLRDENGEFTTSHVK